MYPYGNRHASRNASSGRAEGRFLEPSQLRLQATGNSVAEKSRDIVKPVLDFRLTKDNGVVKAASDLTPSNSLQNNGPNMASRRVKVDQASLPDGVYGLVHSDTSSKSVRSSSAAVTMAAHSHSSVNDVVMVAESSTAAGVPIIYRTPEEKENNPDRLNLDRRRLTVCPILDGEDALRLLNYQHNLIRKIQNLHGLKKLIFLDLYDNQVEEISGLSHLKSLRVLMLGKNRIKKIEHLESLIKLDVLDLHGNEIQVIENLSHLTELRVLNLAGNRISFVDNVTGMMSLAELNLRRNQIRSLTDIEQLPSLLRLFLSCNELSSFSDIACLAKSVSIQEVSLDGNPLASDQFYKQMVLSNMPQLKQLDMKRVTDEEKRISSMMAKKEEDRKKELQKISVMKEKRKQAIHTAKKQWELMQASMIGKTNRLNHHPELFANHVATYDNNTPGQGSDDDRETDSSPDLQGDPLRPLSAQADGSNLNRFQRNMERIAAKDRSQSESRPMNPVVGHRPSGEANQVKEMGNGLAELNGDTLTCYGPGSVDSLERNWGLHAAGNVFKIIFKFIEIGDVVLKGFTKIRIKFPSVHTYEFNANNIHSLEQLNALSMVRRIEHLILRDEGNPVTQITNWKLYIIFRLAHFNIKTINGQAVTSTDILTAEKMFGPVSHMVASALPGFRLLALLPDIKKKQFLAEEKSKAPSSSSSDSSTINPYGSETTNRAVLNYLTSDQSHHQQQEFKGKLKLARSYVNCIAKEMVAADSKLTRLEANWNRCFTELVHQICLEVSDIDNCMKETMEKFLKGENS